MYLETVLSLLSESPIDEEQVARAREKLQALFRESNLYRVQYLLGKTSNILFCSLLTCSLKIFGVVLGCKVMWHVMILKTLFLNIFHCLRPSALSGKMENCEKLLLERATLHGKLEEHDKALHILVHRLKDFPSAEAFCTWASSGRDSSYQQQLFHQLLEVYLDGSEAAVGGGSGDLKIAAVDLLNRHGEMFDAVRVLRLLPEEWSLQLLRPFLGRAIRASMHACRTSQIALGLCRSENLQLLHDRVRLTLQLMEI